MSKYRYGFIDAQLVLVRTMKAQEHVSKDGICSRASVFPIFLYTIFKAVRTYDIGRPVLLWDSSPYHKSTILKELLPIKESFYKNNRGYLTEEDLVNTTKEINDINSKLESGELELTDELKTKIDDLQKTIKEATKQVSNFKMRSELKYYIIDTLGYYGISSIIKKGWEADDLAYLMAEYLKNDDCKSTILSTDTDWDYFINENVDKCHPYKMGTIITYDKVINAKNVSMVIDKFECSLFKSKAILDSIYGSHNNLQPSISEAYKDTSLSEILDNIPESLDNDLFNAQMKTWDFTIYPDYEFIRGCLPWYLKNGNMGTVQEFSRYCDDNKMRVSQNKYREMLNYLDAKLWNLGEGSTDIFEDTESVGRPKSSIFEEFNL